MKGCFVNRRHRPYEDTPYPPTLVVESFTALADAGSSADAREARPAVGDSDPHRSVAQVDRHRTAQLDVGETVWTQDLRQAVREVLPADGRHGVQWLRLLPEDRPLPRLSCVTLPGVSRRSRTGLVVL